eukprot:UN02192
MELFFSFSISLPPVLAAGSQYLKDLCAEKIIKGEQQLALACSEPSAGSDVSQVATTAIRRQNAKGEEVFIVNGEKRYITNGMKCTYFTTVVRTAKGLSLLLIDRESPGVKCRRQPTQGWLSSNTAFIEFNNVEVPINRLIGEEGKGWNLVMNNFNQERFVLSAMMVSYSRCCLEDAVTEMRKHPTKQNNQLLRHKVARDGTIVYNVTLHGWNLLHINLIKAVKI